MPEDLSIPQTVGAAALALAFAAWLYVLSRMLRRGHRGPVARGSAGTRGTGGTSGGTGRGGESGVNGASGRAGGRRVRRAGERPRLDRRARRVRSSRADSLRLSSDGWRRGAAARPADPATPQALPALPALPRQRQACPHLETVELTPAEQAAFAGLVRQLTDDSR